MNYRIIIAILIIFNFYLPLSLVPLFDLDEGAFSEATREMLLNHNFITTYLNGDLRFDKPILIYWFQALSVSIFGLNEFALRLPSAIASTFWVCVIYWFVMKYFDEKKAFLSAIFMISSLQINLIAKAAIADALLNMTIAFSMIFLYIYIHTYLKRYLYLAFLFIAIGVLTKGPVAILIPLVVTFLYLFFNNNLKLFFKMVFDIKGIAIFLLVAMPWYILEYIDQGEKFIKGFIFKHNLERFNTSLERHSGSIFYFIPVLLIGILPFTSVLGELFRKYKVLYKNHLYFLIWFLFVFLFFSLSNTKLPHYIVYGYSALFILMGIYFKDYRYGILFVIALFVLLFIFPYVASEIEVKKLYIKEILNSVYDEFGLYYRISLLISIILLSLLLFLKIDSIKRVIFTSFLFSFIINYVVVYSYAKVVQLPIKEAALIVKQNNFKNVIMYGLNTPSFSVYADRIVKKRFPKNGDIVLTKTDSLKHIKKYNIIFHKNGIYLIKVI